MSTEKSIIGTEIVKYKKKLPNLLNCWDLNFLCLCCKVHFVTGGPPFVDICENSPNCRSQTIFRGRLWPFGSLARANIWSSYSLSDISHCRAYTFDDAMTTGTEQLTLRNSWILKLRGKMQVSRMLMPVHINSFECIFIFQCKVRKVSSASRALIPMKIPVLSHFLFQCWSLFFSAH